MSCLLVFNPENGYSLTGWNGLVLCLRFEYLRCKWVESVGGLD
jgi:hypothetical protein